MNSNACSSEVCALFRDEVSYGGRGDNEVGGGGGLIIHLRRINGAESRAIYTRISEMRDAAPAADAFPDLFAGLCGTTFELNGRTANKVVWRIKREICEGT